MSFSLLALMLVAPSAEAKPKPARPTGVDVAPAAASAGTAAVLPVDLAATREQALALWAQRGDAAQLRESLSAYEQVHAADPSDKDALYHLVRGYYFLGDGHLTEKDAKLEVWAKSIAFGNQCLALNKDFSGLLAKGDEDPASASRVLTKDDVPCVYWTSSALGKWAKGSGIGLTLKHLPTVKAYMTRVGELEPAYYYDGPNRYWGAYYAAIPSFAGQDLNKSKEFFDKALASNPAFLGNHVLLAGEWAVKKQDKATFQRELNWVIAADATVLPDVQPEMEAAQRQAKALMAAIEDNFAN